MDAPIQTNLPGLPREHVKAAGGFCELCGSELPPSPPGKTGRKQRWCTKPLGGAICSKCRLPRLAGAQVCRGCGSADFQEGRTSCHALAMAAQRVAAEMPPSRSGEIRKLKKKQAHRKERGQSLAAEDQARLEALMQEVGEEYPVAVRRGFRSIILNLLNRLNSNGWGAA